MKYAFIEDHRSDYSVRRLCAVLNVSKSGYYAWRNRSESPWTFRHRELIGRLRDLFIESQETYGALRLHRDRCDEGERVDKNIVALLMRRAGLMPKTVKRFRVTTDSRNTVAAPNLLKQQFDVEEPNRKWVSDITAIPTREGWLYLCIMLDLYSRAVVGWSMSERIKADLVTEALNMAITRRTLDGPLLVHSDRGSQYTSESYQEMLKNHDMTCSMSRKGCCWDNAVAESFFHSLKTERTHHEKFQTRAHAKMSVFDY
ncbi:MAG: IS3 family transposase, partial [Verrucomicrobiota bacterium]